jgi:S1-C subfamily serine protease
VFVDENRSHEVPASTCGNLSPPRLGMTESPDVSGQPRKLLASGAVKVKIALASGLVLLVGAWLAPRAAPTVLSVPQEHAAPLLEEQAHLREVSRPFEGVQEAAAPVRQHSVAILLPPSPAVPSRNDFSESTTTARLVAGFGVFVSDTHVLTHSAALDGRSVTDVSLGNGLTTAAQVVTYEPPTGLVLLQVQRSEGRTSAPFAVQAPTPGALAVAVGRSDERELAVPVFVTSVGPAEYTMGAVNDALLPGMPVFNLAGELFAIAAPDGRTVRGIPVRQAAERMLTRAATGERRSSFGLGFQVPMGRLTERFGNEGVIISEVLPGGPGDAADIAVGDVLLAVGDVPIDSADTAARALSTAGIGTPITLRVRRGPRASNIQVTPAVAYEIAALARSTADVPAGPEARVLFPAAVREASAIPLAARVVSVNGRALTTRAQVQRELCQARQPLTLLLREGTHQFVAAVEPTR